MTPESFLDGKVVLHGGDCRDVLRTLAVNSIDSIVTDPPYALVSIVKRFGSANAAAVKVPEGGSGAYARASSGFMGKQWDTGEAAFAVEFWAECLRVLKPGGHVVAFSGTRTYHRLTCAIEDAGFEIRDQLAYVYGSGFPKSHDVSKGIDRAAGAKRTVKTGIKPGHEGFANGAQTSSVQSFKGTMGGAGGFSRPWMDDEEAVERYHHTFAPATDAAREWQGWGTALKPAWEPICLARKPLSEKTVAANVLRWGTGAINVDGCRVATEEARPVIVHAGRGGNVFGAGIEGSRRTGETQTTGRWPANLCRDGSEDAICGFPADADGVSASRYFYSAKADADDRLGSKHPTVKPVDLKQWLVRLVTPPNGTILDPFAGTGTTGEAAWREGFRAVLIEREEEYQADIRRRMALCLAGPDERARESIKAKLKGKPVDAGPLFDMHEAAE